MTITKVKTDASIAIAVTGEDCYRVRQLLAGVASIASTDKTRGALCAVRLTVAGNTLTAVATDSYVALQASITLADGAAVSDCDLLMDAKQLAKAVKLIGKRTDSVSLSQTGDVLTMLTSDSSANVEMNYGTFPDSVQSIIDQAGTHGFPRSADTMLKINPSMLANLLAAVSTVLPTDTPAVRLVAVGCDKDAAGNERADRPWLWRANYENVNVDAVIMSLR